MLEEKAGDWDESKHPRDDAGRFGFGGGSADSDDGGGGGKGEHPGKGYSKDAYVDSKGVIQTSSVYDAQRALHENRKVELDQPRKVSVLLQKLGETSARMIKQGKSAPVFNLCNVSIKGTNLFCADTKGIPRVEMPQLDKQQTKDFRKYLKDKGYKVTKEKQFASHLRATQNELNGAKVAAGAQKIIDNDGRVKPIIISKDDYILDGHHAWGAKLGLDAADNKLENDTKMHVHRVNISITKLLEEADNFTGGKGRKGVEDKSFNIGEVFRDWDESEHPRDEDGKFASGGGGGDGDNGAGQTEEQGRRGSGEGGTGGARSPSEAQAVAEKAASGQPKLEGLPSKPLKVGGAYYVPGPFGKAKVAAETYMVEAGLPYNPAKSYLKVDPARATRVAAEFEKMRHDPGDPAVKASYAALAKEVVAQYRAIERTGLKIDFIKPDQPDPYASTPRLAAMDVIDNNHLWVFPTDSGFGTGPEAEASRHNNPMLQMTDVEIGGKKLMVNDVFRIVHDYFGHFKEGVGFRADGEDNAWQSHVVMFSEAARGAMTSETRGQNSWVNYGPFGEANRTASAADTHYAPQKIGLMPEWTWREGVAKAVFTDGEVEVLSALMERGLRLEDCHRRIYVRSHLLTAHHAIALMEAEGFNLIPYDGEYIPGTELIDTREWEERDFDESKHPRGQPGNAGQFGSGGGGGDETASQPAAEAEPVAPAGFNKAEEAALGDYINDSTDLNTYLRSGGDKANKEYDEKIALINSALSKNALASDFTLWRGISECKLARDLRKNAEKLVGQSIPLGGFQSTSSSEDIALEFVGGYNSKVVLEIITPKGSNIIDMQPMADNFAKQKEYLLGEGSLKIQGVTRTGRGSAVLYITGTYEQKKNGS